MSVFSKIVQFTILIPNTNFLFRCGRGVPLPGYRLFSQCDPNGRFPCCNPNTGLCGNQAQDCQCENCTDFRKMVSAELARWQPKKCKLKDYAWQESCSMLNRNNISLHFIGKDSKNSQKMFLMPDDEKITYNIHLFTIGRFFTSLFNFNISCSIF